MQTTNERELLELSAQNNATPLPAGMVLVQKAGTNGLAIASLVLGITWIYWIGSILAIIFGAIALRQTRERGQGGHGLAVAGLTLGIIGVVILAAGLVAWAAGA